MGDLPGHMMMLLMDMSVEHCYILVGRQDVDRLGTIIGRPVPCGVKIEQGTMRENNDWLRFVVFSQIVMQPLQLIFSNKSVWIRDIVERDEMDALVIKAVVANAEHALVRFAIVEAGIILARDKSYILHFKIGNNGLEFCHALTAYFFVWRAMNKVAGKHDEIRLVLKAVHGCDSTFSACSSLRIGRALETPVAVRHLHKEKILPGCSQGTTPRPKARGKDNTPKTGQFKKISAVNF